MIEDGGSGCVARGFGLELMTLLKVWDHSKGIGFDAATLSSFCLC